MALDFDRDLTPDEMVRAARFLFGMADQAERQRVASVVIPVKTVRAIARAVLGAVNVH